MGVEPTSKAWEAFILPMNYACVFFFESFPIIAQLSPFGKGENEKNFAPVLRREKKAGTRPGGGGRGGAFPLKKQGRNDKIFL